MNERNSPVRLLQRSRAAGWVTGIGATLATVGLIAGVTHTAPATRSTTSTTPTANSANSNANANANGANSSNSSLGGSGSSNAVGFGPAQQGQAPLGGSNGS